MRPRLFSLLSIVAIAGVHPAAAQPGPPSAPASRADLRAEALFKAGQDKLRSGDNAAALTLFDEACRVLAHIKCKFALGAAHEGLGHDLEAAALYAEFLASPAAPPKAVPAVKSRLAAVDARLGHLQITVVGATDAELQVGDDAWAAASSTPLRVIAGPFVVRGRAAVRPDTVEVRGDARAGKVTRVTIDLTSPPPPSPPIELPPPPVEPPPEEATHTPATDGVTAALTSSPRDETVEPSATRVASKEDTAAGDASDVTLRTAPKPRARRSRLSLFVGGIGSIVDPGVRGMLGVGYEPHPRVRLGLDVIIGSGPGVAPRATIYLASGRLRPTIHVGVPMRMLERLDNPMGLPCGRVLVDGTKRVSSFEVAAHGGVGVDWRLSRRVGLVAEVGYERYLDIDTCISDANVVTPLVGLVGRL